MSLADKGGGISVILVVMQQSRMALGRFGLPNVASGPGAPTELSNTFYDAIRSVISYRSTDRTLPLPNTQLNGPELPL
jgi:hypothetical protein